MNAALGRAEDRVKTDRAGRSAIVNDPEALGLVDLGAGGEAAVAAIDGLAGTRDCGNRSSIRKLAYPVIVGVGEVDVVEVVDGDPVRTLDLGGRGWSVVAVEASRPGTGNSADGAAGCDLSDAVIDGI